MDQSKGNYVWQQDGASSHISVKKKQIFCKNNMVKFWEKDIWPQWSPDLNPLDFFWWGANERKTNATPYPNIDSLEAAIVKEWADYPSKEIVNASASFRRRVEAVIENNGGHIE